jgi:hypothetical protein
MSLVTQVSLACPCLPFLRFGFVELHGIKRAACGSLRKYRTGRFKKLTAGERARFPRATP